MAKGDPISGTVQSVETSLDVIEQLHEMEEAGATEIADELGLSKGAVHKHLKTLQAAGYAESTNGRYSLGFKFLTLGGKVRGTDDLCIAAREAVAEIVDQTDELASFAVYDNGHCVFTYIENDNYGLKQNLSMIGERYELDRCAEGKAMMASLSDDILLDPGTLHLSMNQGVEELMNEIETIRNRGYAMSTGDMVEGINAIAIPVSNEDTLGALAISGPSNRLTQEKLKEEYSNLLSSIVNEMELRIRFGVLG